MSDVKNKDFEFGLFLDIRTCGSSITGYITEPEIGFYDENSKHWVEGNAVLNLTDCNRSITWDFSIERHRDKSGKVYNTDKMKKVIDALQLYYDKLVEMENSCAELQEKAKAHNATLKKGSDNESAS